MVYTVTFNPAIDYVVYISGGLKLNDINRNASEEFQYGGKGINVSNMLRTLGLPTVALGFVAGFIGEGLERGLAEMGLDTDFIHVAEGMTRINVKVKAGEETEINGIGPTITEADMQKLYAKLDAISPGDTLVLSGSIPKCLSGDSYERIMARLDGRGIRIAVDATRDLLVNVLKYRPFLIKPNNHELGEIFGRVLKTDEEIAELFKEYDKKHFSDFEKLANEDARFILPNACTTKIICTFNARSLYNFFEHRCCNRAQWEIRALADEMLRLCKSEAPVLFANAGPGCVRGACPEGGKTCGKAAAMREKFENM